MKKNLYLKNINNKSKTLHMQRSGSWWTLQEDNDLLSEIERKLSIEEISKLHQRSANAIYLRVVQKASDQISLFGGKSKEEVLRKFNITENDLVRFHERQMLKAKNLADIQSCGKRPENNELFEKMNDIEKRMENIEQTMTEIKQMLLELLNDDKAVSTPFLTHLPSLEIESSTNGADSEQKGFWSYINIK